MREPRGGQIYKVDREFRTSRRALNVLSVRVRTVRAGDLIYLPSPGLPHNGTSVGFCPFGSRFAPARLGCEGGLALDRFFLIYAGCGSSFGRSRFFVVREMARG